MLLLKQGRLLLERCLRALTFAVECFAEDLELLPLFAQCRCLQLALGSERGGNPLALGQGILDRFVQMLVPRRVVLFALHESSRSIRRPRSCS